MPARDAPLCPGTPAPGGAPGPQSGVLVGQPRRPDRCDDAGADGAGGVISAIGTKGVDACWRDLMVMPLFTVLDVEKTYRVGSTPGAGWFSAGQPRLLKALNGVRLEIAQGDSNATVGESCSGKLTLEWVWLCMAPAGDGRSQCTNVDIHSAHSVVL